MVATYKVSHKIVNWNIVNGSVCNKYNRIEWLSVSQMVHFHSLSLVYEMKTDQKPEYFRSKFHSNFPYDTRLSTDAGIRRTDHCTLEVSKTSFVPRTTKLWNELPPDIRTAPTLKSFKNKLKRWVKKTLPIQADSFTIYI